MKKSHFKGARDGMHCPIGIVLLLKMVLLQVFEVVMWQVFFFFFPEHLRKVPYTRNMASMTLLRVEYVLEYYVLEYHT